MSFMKSGFRWIIFLALLSCRSPVDKPKPLSPAITPGDIRSHIEFLAGDSLEGRATGSAGEAVAANYIADHFEHYGLIPAGDDNTYFQLFRVNTASSGSPHSIPDDTTGQQRVSRNVAGIVRGTEIPDEYLVIGAHYDHLGMGGPGSLARNTSRIHNGADDNASGTAGLLELAHYFSERKPRKNVLFVAFSAEEIGLIGSQHFVDHPPAATEQMAAMINLDMIGRLQNNKLLIFGTGSSSRWDGLIHRANSDSLDIKTIPDGTG
ncbi:MAG: M20/M25/M40 family metallo-hydrolase, partial [Balneolaceae bacterium]|nr:M20/M25/M40 family metallo-hydrolase [Balneolaceae bacterium]